MLTSVIVRPIDGAVAAWSVGGKKTELEEATKVDDILHHSVTLSQIRENMNSYMIT